MARDDKMEEKILDEVRKRRESFALLKTLAEMGLNISEEFTLQDGIVGKTMKIRPVRIGMPGTPDEGVVFGESKRDTKYPIDSIKVINNEGQYYVEFLSSKSKGKSITYRKIDMGTEQRQEQGVETSLPAERQKLLPPHQEPVKLQSYQEPKHFPPTEERKLLPQHPEQKLLPSHPEQKLLPLRKEPKRLIAGPEKKLLPPHPEQKLPPQHPEQKLLPPHKEPKRLKAWEGKNLLMPPTQTFKLRVDSEPVENVHFSVDGKTYLFGGGKEFSTPEEIDLIYGPHVVEMPRFFQMNRKNYFFVEWEDHSTDNVRNIDLNEPMEIVAHYEEKEPEKSEKEKWKMYKVFIDSRPQRGAEIKFSYQKKKATGGIGPGSDFDNAVNNYIIDPATRAQIVRVAEDFSKNIGEFSNREDAEKYLRGPLTVIRGHFGDVDYWINEIIDALWGSASGFEIKEIVQGNNRTPITTDLEEGVWLLEAQKETGVKLPDGNESKLIFDRWEALGPTGKAIGTREGDGRLRLVLNDAEIPSMSRSAEGTDIGFRMKRPSIMVTAFYSGTAKHTDRPTALSPYQRGVPSGRFGLSGAKDSLISGALGSSTARERRAWDVKTREIKKDPYILAAINKGKRILNRYAKAEYSRVFTPRKKEYKERARQLRKLQWGAVKARARLRKIITANARAAKLGAFRFRNEDTVNTASKLLEAGGKLEGDTALMQARDALQAYLTARDKYYEDYKKDLESDSAHLRDYLVAKAGIVSTMIARRYKMPIKSADEGLLDKELRDYAVTLAEDFATKGRTLGHALMRGLGIMSRSVETGGAAFTNVFYNIFTFLLGPWTITSLFALLLFYFTFIFVGYNVQILWIMPLIGAAITFLLNFSDTFRPLDWVTHMASGAIIGYSAALLLISLGAPNWNFIGGSNSAGFWIAWIVLGAIGLFQFYQTSGWKVVMQVGVLVLVFAYIALGPYHAYYDQAITQIKAPIEVAYRHVSNAITDIWLLVTNPTEWYARQQLVNVRPERPLDYPKGIEFGSIEVMPPSVPQGQQFAAMAVIKNDGPIDASDVVISYSCNSWCDSRGVDRATNKKEFDEAKGRLDKEILGKIENDNGNSIYVRSSLKRGESHVVSLSPFVASSFPQDRGLTNFAKVGINVSYAYSTNSSLQVDIISAAELEKRFRSGQTVFAPVLAVDKGTPARLSLNVGPQPLKEGTRQLLLVSMSNTRDKSRVVLPRGTKIIINLPNEIGSKLECGNQKTLASKGGKHYKEGYETLVYVVEPSDPAQNSIEILPYEFNSIFSFLCTFKASSSVEVLRSGFITAELPRYVFRVEQTKDVPITPRLGILYDPWENVCKKITDKTDCIARTSGDDACYWSEAKSPEYIPGVVTPIGSDCHSCGPKSNRLCSKFKENDCGTKLGSDACDIDCVWLTLEEMKKRGIPTDDLDPNEKGMCIGDDPIGGTIVSTRTRQKIAQKIIAVANQMKLANADAEVKAAGIANSFEEMIVKLAWSESSLRQCSSGTLSCNDDSTYEKVLCSKIDGSKNSCGVMQISVFGAHPQWRDNVAECGGKGAYDVDCNIRLGITLLIDEYERWGKNGISNPTCKDEPYRSKYKNYRGWMAALRAYNGWGCPKDYSGGQDKAGNYVENLIKKDVSEIMQTAQSAIAEEQAETAATGEWKINGATGLVEIGSYFYDKCSAQIKSISNGKFNIALTCGGDVARCDGDSGDDATLGEGEEAGCDTRSRINPASWGFDNILLKLWRVEAADRNIVLSVGPGDFYGKGISSDASAPLPDWELWVNNARNQAGRMAKVNTPIDVVWISLDDIDVSSNEARFAAYTKTLAGWGAADCSDWPFKDKVTISAGKTEGCVSSGWLPSNENFWITLEKIDATNKRVYIKVPALQ